jgi:3-hydroxyacyl-CoA dehydrogenase
MGIARAGLEVVIYEPERAPLDRSRAAIAASVGRAVTAGKLGAAERNPLLGRISHTTELGDLADADLVIEAVYEDPDVKGRLFKALDDLLPADTILASNTSSIPIAQLASWTRERRAPDGTADALRLHRARRPLQRLRLAPRGVQAPRGFYEYLPIEEAAAA